MTALLSQQQVESRQVQLVQRLHDLAGQRGAEAGFEFHYLQALLQRCPPGNPTVARRILDQVEGGIIALGKRRAEVDSGADDGGNTCKSLPINSVELMARSRLALVQLRRELDARDEPPENSSPKTFADELEAQNRADRFPNISTPRGRPGLQAAKNVAALQAQYQLDRLMATALLAQPEAPGPLNPQGLLIRALTTMGGISPAYLSRFVNYSRTLLWLQRAADKAEQGKPAKGKGQG